MNSEKSHEKSCRHVCDHYVGLLAEAQSTQRFSFHALLLRVLRGHEKKSKNNQNCKFCLNEIKYLQLLIFAKRDFFSRPAPLR